MNSRQPGDGTHNKGDSARADGGQSSSSLSGDDWDVAFAERRQKLMEKLSNSKGRESTRALGHTPNMETSTDPRDPRAKGRQMRLKLQSDAHSANIPVSTATDLNSPVSSIPVVSLTHPVNCIPPISGAGSSFGSGQTNSRNQPVMVVRPSVKQQQGSTGATAPILDSADDSVIAPFARWMSAINNNTPTTSSSASMGTPSTTTLTYPHSSADSNQTLPISTISSAAPPTSLNSSTMLPPLPPLSDIGHNITMPPAAGGVPFPPSFPTMIPPPPPNFPFFNPTAFAASSLYNSNTVPQQQGLYQHAPPLPPFPPTVSQPSATVTTSPTIRSATVLQSPSVMPPLPFGPRPTTPPTDRSAPRTANVMASPSIPVTSPIRGIGLPDVSVPPPSRTTSSVTVTVAPNVPAQSTSRGTNQISPRQSMDTPRTAPRAAAAEFIGSTSQSAASLANASSSDRQFMVPCQLLFCQLCSHLSPDEDSAKLHLKSAEHYINYNKFLSRTAKDHANSPLQQPNSATQPVGASQHSHGADLHKIKTEVKDSQPSTSYANIAPPPPPPVQTPVTVETLKLEQPTPTPNQSRSKISPNAGSHSTSSIESFTAIKQPPNSSATSHGSGDLTKSCDAAQNPPISNPRDRRRSRFSSSAVPIEKPVQQAAAATEKPNFMTPKMSPTTSTTLPPLPPPPPAATAGTSTAAIEDDNMDFDNLKTILNKNPDLMLFLKQANEEEDPIKKETMFATLRSLFGISDPNKDTSGTKKSQSSAHSSTHQHSSGSAPTAQPLIDASVVVLKSPLSESSSSTSSHPQVQPTSKRRSKRYHPSDSHHHHGHHKRPAKDTSAADTESNSTGAPMPKSVTFATTPPSIALIHPVPPPPTPEPAPAAVVPLSPPPMEWRLVEVDLDPVAAKRLRQTRYQPRAAESLLPIGRPPIVIPVRSLADHDTDNELHLELAFETRLDNITLRELVAFWAGAWDSSHFTSLQRYLFEFPVETLEQHMMVAGGWAQRGVTLKAVALDAAELRWRGVITVAPSCRYECQWNAVSISLSRSLVVRQVIISVISAMSNMVPGILLSPDFGSVEMDDLDSSDNSSEQEVGDKSDVAATSCARIDSPSSQGENDHDASDLQLMVIDDDGETPKSPNTPKLPSPDVEKPNKRTQSQLPTNPEDHAWPYWSNTTIQAFVSHVDREFEQNHSHFLASVLDNFKRAVKTDVFDYTVESQEFDCCTYGPVKSRVTLLFTDPSDKTGTNANSDHQHSIDDRQCARRRTPRTVIVSGWHESVRYATADVLKRVVPPSVIAFYGSGLDFTKLDQEIVVEQLEAASSRLQPSPRDMIDHLCRFNEAQLVGAGEQTFGESHMRQFEEHLTNRWTNEAIRQQRQQQEIDQKHHFLQHKIFIPEEILAAQSIPGPLEESGFSMKIESTAAAQGSMDGAPKSRRSGITPLLQYRCEMVFGLSFFGNSAGNSMAAPARLDTVPLIFVAKGETADEAVRNAIVRAVPPEMKQTIESAGEKTKVLEESLRQQNSPALTISEETKTTADDLRLTGSTQFSAKAATTTAGGDDLGKEQGEISSDNELETILSKNDIDPPKGTRSREANETVPDSTSLTDAELDLLSMPNNRRRRRQLEQLKREHSMDRRSSSPGKTSRGLRKELGGADSDEDDAENILNLVETEYLDALENQTKTGSTEEQQVSSVVTRISKTPSVDGGSEDVMDVQLLDSSDDESNGPDKKGRDKSSSKTRGRNKGSLSARLAGLSQNSIGYRLANKVLAEELSSFSNIPTASFDRDSTREDSRISRARPAQKHRFSKAPCDKEGDHASEHGNTEAVDTHDTTQVSEPSNMAEAVMMQQHLPPFHHLGMPQHQMYYQASHGEYQSTLPPVMPYTSQYSNHSAKYHFQHYHPYYAASGGQLGYPGAVDTATSSGIPVGSGVPHPAIFSNSPYGYPPPTTSGPGETSFLSTDKPLDQSFGATSGAASSVDDTNAWAEDIDEAEILAKIRSFHAKLRKSGLGLPSSPGGPDSQSGTAHASSVEKDSSSKKASRFGSSPNPALSSSSTGAVSLTLSKRPVGSKGRLLNTRPSAFESPLNGSDSDEDSAARRARRKQYNITTGMSATSGDPDLLDSRRKFAAFVCQQLQRGAKRITGGDDGHLAKFYRCNRSTFDFKLAEISFLPSHNSGGPSQRCCLPRLLLRNVLASSKDGKMSSKSGTIRAILVFKVTNPVSGGDSTSAPRGQRFVGFGSHSGDAVSRAVYAAVKDLPSKILGDTLKNKLEIKPYDLLLSNNNETPTRSEHRACDHFKAFVHEKLTAPVSLSDRRKHRTSSPLPIRDQFRLLDKFKSHLTEDLLENPSVFSYKIVENATTETSNDGDPSSGDSAKKFSVTLSFEELSASDGRQTITGSGPTRSLAAANAIQSMLPVDDQNLFKPTLAKLNDVARTKAKEKDAAAAASKKSLDASPGRKRSHYRYHRQRSNSISDTSTDDESIHNFRRRGRTPNRHDRQSRKCHKTKSHKRRRSDSDSSETDRSSYSPGSRPRKSVDKRRRTSKSSSRESSVDVEGPSQSHKRRKLSGSRDIDERKCRKSPAYKSDDRDTKRLKDDRRSSGSLRFSLEKNIKPDPSGVIKMEPSKTILKSHSRSRTPSPERRMGATKRRSTSSTCDSDDDSNDWVEKDTPASNTNSGSAKLVDSKPVSSCLDIRPPNLSANNKSGDGGSSKSRFGNSQFSPSQAATLSSFQARIKRNNNNNLGDPRETTKSSPPPLNTRRPRKQPEGGCEDEDRKVRALSDKLLRACGGDDDDHHDKRRSRASSGSTETESSSDRSRH